jgi:hypothetical protein
LPPSGKIVQRQQPEVQSHPSRSIRLLTDAGTGLLCYDVEDGHACPTLCGLQMGAKHEEQRYAFLKQEFRLRDVPDEEKS